MNEAGPSFEAYAFHLREGEATAEPGRAFIHHGQLHFESDGLALEIPLVQLEATLGNGADFELRLASTVEPGWTICTPDDTILTNAELRRASNVHEQVATILGRQELKHRLKITSLVILACILIAWLGSITMGLMVRSVVHWVPLTMEAKWGQDELKDLNKYEEFSDNTNRLTRLEALVHPLLAVVTPGQSQFKFYILESYQPNAFALPGGHVIVTTALLRQVDRPEELLGVVAHELAHLQKRHFLREKISSAGPLLILAMFARRGGGVGELLAGGSALLIHQSFSQEYETEADDAGWDYLVAANIDPRGMIEMFEKFKAYEFSAGEGNPQALRSHPETQKRIDRLEKKWRQLKTKDGFLKLDPKPL